MTATSRQRPSDAGPLEVLRRLRRPVSQPSPGETCDICAVPVPDDHGHVVDLDSRRLRCACRACALLFTNEGAAGGRWRSVAPDVFSLPDVEISTADWEALGIPVGVAFFLKNSETGTVTAFYPSPAGATESTLPLETYDRLANDNPMLGAIKPDVQSLLVRSTPGAVTAYVAPIDVCYSLVGLLRQSWRGFDGGTEARDRIEAFFATLDRRARPLPAEVGRRG